MSTRTAPGVEPGRATWIAVLRRYFAFILTANLAWEIAHLPLYTIWREGSRAEIAFAVVHCTGGDMLIAGVVLLLALFGFGNAHWPDERYGAVALFALVAGIGYTIFSEWLNTTVRVSWAYSDLMPTLPLIGVGISPLAQWTLIPLLAFFWARRRRSFGAGTRGQAG
ncbi:MAG: hypothetical protein HY056_05520 [Proteobacteria bacterium]|nr:hypothetical protein [Pseudomonadota bacterium]